MMMTGLSSALTAFKDQIQELLPVALAFNLGKDFLELVDHEQQARIFGWQRPLDAFRQALVVFSQDVDDAGQGR